jgi:ABC-type transport system involved in multi-copper enzyme maturation permease subunit
VTGLVAAELLKLRRRWATYIVPGTGIVLMTLIFALVFASPRGSGADSFLRFPTAYTFINQFVFGLGSLLAIAYAAAVGGADWSWGVIRVVIARGEGRARYVLAKAIGLGIALTLGTLVVVVCGVGLVVLAGTVTGRPSGNPIAGESLMTLLRSIAYGSTVLLERCAIGFAVAFLLRSQLAGVVAGIVLYIGESILSTILLVMTVGAAGGGSGIGRQVETQWYQFLPFSIGNSLLGEAAPSASTDLSSVFLTPVPLPQALGVTLLYLVLAVGIAMLVTVRAEISS